MRAANWVVSYSAGLLLSIACATTISAATMASTAEGNAQITVLYDAFGKTSTMQKDWGYAALVEYGGKRILFDTGNNPEILAQNTKAKGVDLTKLDFVVMSHRHAKYFGKVRDDINRAVCCVSQLKVKANDGDSTES